MTTATPPQVDRAEIRRELDRFVLRSVQPMGLRVLSIDDAVAVATARELVSRQEIGRLRASIDKALAVCDAGEWQATRWEQPFPVPSWVTDIRAALVGVSETPEACDE